MKITDIEYLLTGSNDSYHLIYILLIGVFIFVFPFILNFLFECIFSIKSSFKYNKNRLFNRYMPNIHLQGEKLRSMSINKDYILITEDFFDGIYRHKKIYSNAPSQCKLEWLLSKEVDNNIIIIARCGDFSTKFANLISYCVYYNLPICRIIDSKPDGFKELKETLPEGVEIIYYMRKS